MDPELRARWSLSVGIRTSGDRSGGFPDLVSDLGDLCRGFEDRGTGIADRWNGVCGTGTRFSAAGGGKCVLVL